MTQITPNEMNLGFLQDTITNINEAVNNQPYDKEVREYVTTFLGYGLEEAEDKIAFVLTRAVIEEAMCLAEEEWEALDGAVTDTNMVSRALEDLHEAMIFGDMDD